MLRSSHLAVMDADLVSKGARLPALHPGAYHCEIIDTAALNCLVPPDLFEAFAAKHLARAGYVFDVHKPIVVNWIWPILEWRPHQTQPLVASHLAEQILEVAGVERNISVEAGYNVMRHLLSPGVARMKGIHLPGKMTLLALRHAQQLNPRICRRIAKHDIVCAVG